MLTKIVGLLGYEHFGITKSAYSLRNAWNLRSATSVREDPERGGWFPPGPSAMLRSVHAHESILACTRMLIASSASNLHQF